ncbi:MAG: target of Sbf [Chrysothrix sp. TS-e1954]|nr:MAG: target of Sbf [Chrysothrix sp. TS-e1954]
MQALLYLAVAATFTAVKADPFNTFTSKVSHIQYHNIGGSGSYQATTEVDGMNACKSQPKDVSGAIAPFNEEVTVMLRAPIKLAGFAFYNQEAPAAGKTKRDEPLNHDGNITLVAEKTDVDRAHGHGHKHLHAKRSNSRLMNAKRCDEVTATIDGEVQTWCNNYFGGAASPATGATVASAAPAPAAPAPAAPKAESQNVPSDGDEESRSKGSAPKSPLAPAPHKPPPSSGPDSWTLQAHFSSNPSTKSGLTFTNVQPVAPYTGDPSSSLTSDASWSIWSSDPCTPSNPCTYSNPSNTINNHGFSGASKAFAFTFSMPDDPSPPAGAGYPNAPAIWLLNSEIPRIQEFGCSCSSSGCGELDLFEVISDPQSGDPELCNKCTSTLYGLGDGTQRAGAGSQSFFERPRSGFVKAIAVLEGGKATIGMLDDSVDITSLTTADIQGVVQMAEQVGTKVAFSKAAS